jgi:hypothetical protein
LHPRAGADSSVGPRVFADALLPRDEVFPALLAPFSRLCSLLPQPFLPPAICVCSQPRSTSVSLLLPMQPSRQLLSPIPLTLTGPLSLPPSWHDKLSIHRFPSAAASTSQPALSSLAFSSQLPPRASFFFFRPPLPATFS